MNLYADLTMFRSRFSNASDLDVSDATEIARTLEASSRRVDGFCRRIFYALTETRIFHGNDSYQMRIPDLIAATSVKLDENYDTVFETTLTSPTDYVLEREFGDNIDDTPKDLIRLNIFTGSRAIFLGYRRLLQIIGRWGYGEDVERLTAVGTLSSTSDTTLTTDVDTDGICVGQTLKLEEEQVYVSDGDASPYTVVRAVNGTTAAAHSAVALDRYVYQPEVREATLIDAGRKWKRREAAYIADGKLDPDAAELLAPLRRLEFG